ncbi:MAG TPA: tetraacyldisaccharide 4'-kinase [Gammaproteobacteria bacterium]
MRLALTRLFDWIWYRPNPLRWLLWPVSLLFRGLSRLRESRYRSGSRSVVELGVPVVVVGNISLGGTGKTPSVIWLARELESRGLVVGIVSRGYGGKARVWPQRVETGSDPAAVGDEPVLIARATRCLVVVAPDRVAAAKAILASRPVDVILSDDGLQHYALARDFEIAVIDAARGIGNGLCLPAGPLREPASRLDEVDAVIVNGTGDWTWKGAVRAVPRPGRPYRWDGQEERELAEFSAARVHAVAGIANPSRFFSMLEAAGLDVIPHPHPDHARLRRADVEFRDKLPVFITEKDAVKLPSGSAAEIWSVPLILEFANGDGERLVDLVVETIAR